MGIIKMPPEMIQPSKNDLDHTKFIERAFFQMNNQSLTKVGSDIIYWISDLKKLSHNESDDKRPAPAGNHRKPGKVGLKTNVQF